MRRHFTSALVAALLMSLSGQAWSIGADTPRKPPAQPQPVCKKGYVYSTIRKKCVKTLSETVPDSELKAQGWALAEAGDYEAAIELFRLVADTADAEALNGLGYSNRKLGRLETGISFYRRALGLAPDYHRAREYLGEGYVAAGKVVDARAELAEIGRRCGFTCEEYFELASVIETAGR